MPNKCTVLRDGHEQKVEAHELVPGDLVRLYIGDRVPADIRIIETFDLKVRRMKPLLLGHQDTLLVVASVRWTLVHTSLVMIVACGAVTRTACCVHVDFDDVLYFRLSALV